MDESPLARLRRLEGESTLNRAPPRPPGSGAPGPGPSRRKGGVLGGIGAVILIVLVKSKTLLLLLVTKGSAILSLLKVGKLFATLATMGISIVYYTERWGAKFAAGFVGLILVHELGHGAAAKIVGLRVGAPIFIPGFGAFISLKEQVRSTWQNFVIGYGGPLAGTLGGTLVLAAGMMSGDDEVVSFTRALAELTFIINLFNLLPVFHLDGDRISEPLKTRHWITGLAATSVIVLLQGAPAADSERGHPEFGFVLLILILGVVKAILVHRRASHPATVRLVDRLNEAAPAPLLEEATVSDQQRTIAALSYFGLVVLLSALARAAAPYV